MRREFLDHVPCWNTCDLERKLADFQSYDNAARSHASLEGHTPLTFAGGHPVGRAELNNVRWVSTAGTWSSSQWRPDNEFETDTRSPKRLDLSTRYCQVAGLRPKPEPIA